MKVRGYVNSALYDLAAALLTSRWVASWRLECLSIVSFNHCSPLRAGVRLFQLHQTSIGQAVRAERNCSSFGLSEHMHVHV